MARRLEANKMVFKAAKIVQKFNIEGSVNHVQANRFFNINIYFKFVPVHIREIKIHVYRIRQTANVSGEFLRIENKQLKKVQNDSCGQN